MVRSELFRWVQLLSRRAWRELSELDWEGGRLGPEEWAEAMEEYWPEFEEIAIDANARGPLNFSFDPTSHAGRATQVLVGVDGESSWRLVADVDSDASREAGAPILRVISVGPIATFESEG